ncbi:MULTISPECIES: hypothetical protein [Streptomyces]|uniref:Uncharacterized protein n=1 Tax=Streptomyces chartreusis NRRL 3882 TaxID=1079985 RepID=A0A2N9BLC9_STRCX|nr:MULTISPECIES: hypothetical protein [Streptomyces]MYS88556.1 hypothetical protein [Streptomyces sp. SID5464]SOR84173.1 hypothetical protein SCNRRL3882_7618 [Streptomyces chartreusis NRRL 3882]
MPTSPTVRPMTPATVWLARGRHAGGAAEDVLRRSLELRKRSRAIDDFLELPQAETEAGTEAGTGAGTEAAPAERAFEARWRVEETVTVRARIGVTPGPDGGQEWILVAEAERPWNNDWPSPAALFWPEEPDVAWDRDGAVELSLGKINPLPQDDKDTRRLFRNAVPGGWHIHVVVHEAMTTDERGRLPVARWLPAGLRHRVVEHRAAPQQLRGVNWALRDAGVQVPRGGAVVLPGTPAPEGYDAEDFSVRAVFLDGSEPAGLVDAVTRYAALPRPLPEGAEDALTALREDWHLLTLQEELERQRGLVAMYAEALEAMTKSRDLYREAAERAHEALAAYQESAAAAPVRQQPSDASTASPLHQLTRTFERLKSRSQRPVAPSRDER